MLSSMFVYCCFSFFFFFQAEDGIRDLTVTGVQTCALPIFVAKSGLRDLLRDVDAPFVDLNIAGLTRVPIRSNWTQLGELWLPTDVVEADIVDRKSVV